MEQTDSSSPGARRSTAATVGWIALAIIPLNMAVWLYGISSPRRIEIGFFAFVALALAQLVLGIAAIVLGRRERRRSSIRFGAVAAVGAVVGGSLGVVAYGLAMLGGAAWGRPLRIRGRQTYPTLREGSDWTLGARPDPQGLDEPTRLALAELWWHDAQKEHASVPAFARVSWLLAAAGAPAELLEWSHRAAMEEIAHTRACFALAAGYAGRSRTVEPMPDLLLEGLSEKEDPRLLLARESLTDGCQLEDFNADVAAACAAVCEEPVTRATLERIAREERGHAAFSWAILDWLLDAHRSTVEPALNDAIRELDRYARPTAVSFGNRRILAAARPDQLRSHGRLTDSEWGRMWDSRLVETKREILRRLNLRAA
ncbi:MAG TPA: hypothetical protein VFY29_12295 [Terriglobia bacterium]|nr:hypothetical protein [Terriglobia bacterium]